MKPSIFLRAIACISILTLAAPASFAAGEAAQAAPDTSLRTTAAASAIVAADGTTLESPASHIFLMDYTTGAVLANKAGDAKMYPSSMTKIMTLYLIFEKLKQGTIGLDSQFTVSENAWRMQGSKMFVPLGGQIGLEDLIRGIAIQSGNDACVVVAEGIAGSEAAFAEQMNAKAAELGMKHSHFMDASGWPHVEHYTSAEDLALLSQALIRDFPEQYHYLSEPEFTYHNIRQFNRNLLLGNKALGVDGIKTGHTDAAGYGIVLSAKNSSGRRLVLVINGLDSEALRASEGERFLQWGFLNFDNLIAFRKDAPIAQAKIWMGESREVALTVAEDVVVTLPEIGREKVKARISYASPLIAPITQGQEVGTLELTLPNGDVKSVPLIASASVEKLGLFGRIPRALGL